MIQDRTAHVMLHIGASLYTGMTVVADFVLSDDFISAFRDTPLAIVCIVIIYYSWQGEKRRTSERTDHISELLQSLEKRHLEEQEVRKALYHMIGQNATLMAEVRDRVQRCPVVEYRERTARELHKDFNSEKDIPR